MKDWTGYLQLHVTSKNGKTIVQDAFFQGAFKLTRPIYHDLSGQPCVYVMNLGGGYVDGDTYRMDITLEEQSELLLTTQASTKVYKTRSCPPVQETYFTLKKGSLLEYLPDSLIAYERAKYKQKNVVHMEKGATLIMADMITSGWSPTGELFSYDHIQLKTEVVMDGQCVVYDHIKLDPRKYPLHRVGLMEGYTHFGSMVVINEQIEDAFINSLYEELSKEAVAVKFGLSALVVPGFTLRVLASSTQEMEWLIGKCHERVRHELFDRSNVELRKY